MKQYIIADTHFNHENIIKYCNRPFKNTLEMNKYIIDKWNSIVNKDDIVYHLGDFAFDKNINIENIVKQLNGTIYLIRGNHDRKSINFYEKIGIHILPTKHILDKYILSHRPLEDNQIPDNYINIHGHIHNKELESTFSKDKHICVSVELINYEPIEINEV